jgi:DNA repair exonuclease SbcCD nuclease subunit
MEGRAVVTKLLAFADLHLGHGSQIPGRLDDQREVLGRIAGLALEHGVDGILFAGDAFEGPASAITPEQLDVFASFVFACRTVEIPILAINGNGAHDAAVRSKNGLAIFNHVDGITVSSYPDVYSFAGCTVATLPWVHPGRLIARAGREVPRSEINAICADLLVDIARRGIEDCRTLDPDAPAILLGHGQVSGTSLPTGLPVDSLSGPTVPFEELESLGYDAIVYGDIHKPQMITGENARELLDEPHTFHGNGRARTAVDEQVGELDALDLWLDASDYQGDRDLLRSRAALYLETVA